MSLAGFISACAYFYLAYHSQYYAHTRLFDLWLSCSIASIVCISAWAYFSITKQAVSVFTLLFWAVIFRIIGILAFPVLEDDFYRYLWDGFQFVESGSPYTHPPAYFFTNETLSETFEDILNGINYPDINTIYAPVCQWVFAVAYLIAPGEIWPVQLIFSLFDIALIFLLLRLAAAKYVLLYAWNPLVIKETAFTAHPDILGVFFLFAAIILARKYILYSAALLALAVGSKIFALVIAPLILGFRWRGWLAFTATLLLICAPFLHDFIQMTIGLRTMAELWLFNAPLYMLLLNIFPPTWVKFTLLFIFTCIWFFYAYKYVMKNSLHVPRGDYLFAFFLICIPVLNPWYLIWLLPFAVVYPSYWAWITSVAVLLSYAIGLNLDASSLAAYEQPIWAISLEYILILIAILIDIYRNRINTLKLLI